MFKIAQNPSYKWPVTIHIPQDGKFTKASFTAEFKGMSQPEIDAVIQAGRDGNLDGDLCREVLVGWTGVQDPDGSDLTYSDETKGRLIAIPYVRSALIDAFFESITGAGARRKN